jgi:serine/threonine-protein kinase
LCPRCHRAIPPDAVGGACPACLLAAAFFSQTATAASGHDEPPPAISELAPEFPALELIELLGRGGMGAVYKARQRDLDRHVALKILRPGLDADPTFAARFTDEARALARLNHPGIVTLHEL